MSQPIGAGILGVGMSVPDGILSNADLEKLVETSDEWIMSRTGIRERRMCSPDETSSTLGSRAALKALEDAGARGPAQDQDGDEPVKPAALPLDAELHQHEVVGVEERQADQGRGEGRLAGAPAGESSDQADGAGQDRLAGQVAFEVLGQLAGAAVAA